MIIDKIENAELYYGVSEEICEALKFMKEHSSETEPIQISENLNIKMISYNTKEDYERQWEAHDHLIDIHYVAEGSEDLCWANRSELHFLKKEEGKDVLRYEGKGVRFTLGSGMFAIVFPEDGHKTRLNTGGISRKVLKGVAKISV